ncbi:unnamed protein product [Caenorhabditis bovis]|uniref:Dystroglycan-type cadherin-like domain-containing protein n=1 Tax=Caenorhabditis bovis TaxID=2654633 RepID=A0A8S1F8S3_9PELO|nr:unnamed protein product [Caenorhabditis bovis]
MSILLLLLLLLNCLQLFECFNIPQHVQATKGKFFVHNLHSANFFPSTVKVKWEATLNNKPALPSWLRLMPSRHPEIAYLIGTPVTNVPQITIHVIAKRLDNFEIQQKMLVINLVDDSKYNGYTKEIFELPLNNLELEEFVSNRNRKIEQLENALKMTFRGKNVNPYIVDVRHKYLVPKGKEHIFNNKGIIVSVGTQYKFYPGTVAMVHNLHDNPAFCQRPSSVAMNRNFAPMFEVDWCNVNLRNATLVTNVEEEPIKAPVVTQPIKGKKSKNETKASDRLDPPPQEIYGYSGYNFWNSVILFPAIGIVCVILLLVLSIIFFGSREGQKWRDYKTSRETLEEYISVRESQKHLRELSVQRQLISMSQDSSAVPTGIHSFLQPRSRMPSTVARFSKSASRLNDKEETVELLPVLDRTPVGKQTVAEAAKQCGSSLHLYRNPLDSESDENASDNSSQDR